MNQDPAGRLLIASCVMLWPHVVAPYCGPIAWPHSVITWPYSVACLCGRGSIAWPHRMTQAHVLTAFLPLACPCNKCTVTDLFCDPIYVLAHPFGERDGARLTRVSSKAAQRWPYRPCRQITRPRVPSPTNGTNSPASEQKTIACPLSIPYCMYYTKSHFRCSSCTTTLMPLYTHTCDAVCLHGASLL